MKPIFFTLILFAVPAGAQSKIESLPPIALPGIERRADAETELIEALTVQTRQRTVNESPLGAYIRNAYPALAPAPAAGGANPALDAVVREILQRGARDER